MLFFPVSRQSIARLIDARSDSSAHTDTLAAHALSSPETASLLVIQAIPGLLARTESPDVLRGRAERLLAKAMAMLRALPDRELRSYLEKSLDPIVLAEGRAALEEQGIFLMSDTEVRDEKYTDANGDWLWGYAPPREDPEPLTKASFGGHSFGSTAFTPDQLRVLSTIAGNQDESLDIAGYAGTGKTKIISAVVDVLDSARVLLLANSQGQVDAALKRIDKRVEGLDFSTFATRILEDKEILKTDQATKLRQERVHTVTYAAVAEKMAYPCLGALSPVQVADCVVGTVVVFCRSADQGIRISHIPRKYASIERQHKDVIKQFAKELWRETLEPGDGIALPLRGYHRVKILQLSDEQMPETVSHVIVDESHDLSDAVRVILTRGEQAIFTFGDPYQNLGRPAMTRRADQAQHRQMAYSLRAGNNVAHLYNDILVKHPNTPTELFHGRRNRTTSITGYTKFSVPDRHCAILSYDLFGLFVVVQRMFAQGARYHVLGGSEDLKLFVSDAIDLYHGKGTPSHRAFRKFSNWDDFAGSCKDPLLGSVERLFSRGYTAENLELSLGQAEASLGPGMFAIGTIESAKNREFRTVMLTPDVLRVVGESEYDRAVFLNHVYTGISRALEAIVVPGDLVDWIKGL